MIRLSIAFILCLAWSFGLAQTGTVKGRVMDATTNEPLPFCNVFINNSTLGATTDLEGSFEVRNVPIPGVYELVISYTGYGSYSQKISISEDLSLRTIYLQASQTVLGAVEVKSSRDKAWEKKLKKFSKIFLGTGKQADQCQITNPWVIDFPESKDRSFSATANLPIEIENKALGYKVKFFLVRFASTTTDYTITGKTFFEELPPENHEQATLWTAERARSYRNSRQHLFKAIVNRKISAEGFKLYSELDKTTSRQRSQFFYTEIGKSVLPADTVNMVTEGSIRGTFGIRMKTRLEVHNMAEKDNASIYRDVLHPISWIESRSGMISVTSEGFEVGSSDAVVFGTMNQQRVSQLVPVNYHPPVATETPLAQDYIDFLQEKIYVQTDKPYYYPGETVWFKGYIRYRTPSLRDSLSATVYAELIDSTKNVAATKILEIIDGSFQNEFFLPDTLAAGDYFLRYYTNANRNFGDDKLFIKYIPVLAMRQAPDPAVAEHDEIENALVAIKSVKPVFKLREKIELDLSSMVSDPAVLAGANLSISVTDVHQVVPLHLNATISDEVEFGDSPPGTSFSHPVERGFGFEARFDAHDKKEKDLVLHVFQLQPRYYTLAQSDKSGNFSVNGLTFYDSAWFAIVPNGLDDGDNDLRLKKREVPPVHLPAGYSKPAIQQTSLAQRAGDYKTDATILLEEVEVRASRINSDKQVTHYGRPDYVLLRKDIKDQTGSLLFALQGKIQGLMVRQVFVTTEGTRWVVYLQRNATTGKRPPEVLVTVNGNVVSGTPEEVLTSIKIGTVESVELSLRSGMQYGRKGTDGILAVYTNADRSQESQATTKVLVHGYSRPLVFPSPDYSTPSARASTKEDFRSTIYWNPNIRLDETGNAKVEFFAADLKGQYKIVVEGLAVDGTPIHAEKVITIVDGN
ncbi:MAG TPA: carboxypeptidase-like regulatory domain-containing protein [Cyclobacteriaceae bacterium]|nr:carboxypeptidase-like regulatory domain-containing protein [Cyclobacteriaceae bacterium]